MDTIIHYICIPFGALMKLCWQIVVSYGWAIILFTLMTKVILLPLSTWVHKNSINMVKIQPAVNFIKVNHYGDMDAIADEQAKLFKREKYHPMLSLLPLILQIVLLLGVVQVIYHPLDYILGVDGSATEALMKHLGLDAEMSSYQLRIVEAIQQGKITSLTAVEGLSADALASVISTVNGFNATLFGINLLAVPSVEGGWYWLMPVVAGLSSWLLCFAQNKSNVIQHEQGKLSKYGLTVVSVGISLYLGTGVPAGIAVYWVAGNIFAILQMYAFNAIISPKKYVDYEQLEASRKALEELEMLDAGNERSPEYRKNLAREKADYKRFFSVVNKHVVFYSEKSGFYKYFEAIIDELIARSNVTIHYVTNDPKDIIFNIAENQPRIKPYYIGQKKFITLMMRLETDIMVMTTPDLDKYHIKRSYMKKDIEYIYVPHDMGSIHVGFSEGALNAFDTIFCSGPHVEREMIATEKVYGLPEKTHVRFGYPLADKLIEAGERERQTHREGTRREILIAPSWQEDNLLDSCIDGLIESLYCDQYHITVRPHPEYIKRFPAKMSALVDRFSDKVGDGLTFELDFLTNRSTYASDIVITDWSGIGMEFCFATLRPAIYVNTKEKILNPNWHKIGMNSRSAELRSIIGVALEKDEVCNARSVAEELFSRADEYESIIRDVREGHIFNIGHAGEVGAKYILRSLVAKKKSGK